MNLSLQKRLGYGGRKRPWRRRANTWLATMLARKKGGVVFLSEDALLSELRRRLELPPGRPLEDYVAELLADVAMERAYLSAVERHGPADATGGPTAEPTWSARVAALRGVVAVYYALLREVRPAVVVETGTAAGAYTSFALAALHRNDHGRLISIDIPAVAGRLTMDISVPESEVGYFIPAEHRDRWEYRRGDAKVLLPRVMLEEDVDVFIHDSLHTTTHMLFEYAVARALMNENALIISDDIMWNSAFQDFLCANKLVGYSPYGRPDTGVCLNTFGEFERRSGLGVQDVAR